MKTRTLFVVLLLGMSSFFGATASAACQEIHFSDGQKFCFDIQKLSSERFQAKTSSSNLSSISELSCRLELPNETQVILPRCEGEFNYGGSNGAIKLRADIPNYRYTLEAHYDFRNGSFDSGNSYTSVFWPEIISISTERPMKDQRVDLTLRVKSSNYGSSYQGNAKFRVEQYKNGRRVEASRYDYELERISYTFSSYENGEKRFDRLLRLRTEGEFRLYVEIDGGSSTYKTLTVETNTSSHYRPEWLTPSTSRPSQNEWVDMTLRVNKEGFSTAYNGSVDFRVEQWRSGRRETASQYDYQLDRTSYTFVSSENGEVRLRNFVKFTTNGEFRVIAQLRDNGNVPAYQTFNVNTTSHASSVDALSITAFYPSSPRIDEWIDITVRAEDRYGNKVATYDSRMRIEVEEYRNGYRRTASDSSFELDQRSYSFPSSDYGEKTFNDALRLRTSGAFRIKAVDANQSSIYGTKEINITPSSSNNNRNNGYYSTFTDKELGKIRAVVAIWKEVIIALEKDYPKLRNSFEWKRLSDEFYSDMQDILRNSSSTKLRNRSDFYSAFQVWLSFTVRTR